MAAGRHLEKWICRHNLAEGGFILAKFGWSMQNDTLMTKIRLKSKPEVEFRHGHGQSHIIVWPTFRAQ